VLDDNRVYRMTESHPPASEKPTPRTERQSNKRRRLNRGREDKTDETSNNTVVGDNSFGGMDWECVAVTLSEVRNLVQAFAKTRDKNEKILRQQLEDHLLPILEKQEESRKRKEQQRERELLNLAKMANAKRSSRIAGKVERQKQEDFEKEEEERSRAAEASRRREEQQQFKMERERGLRLVSREQRLKERETRRLQHEEELATLSEDSSKLFDGKGRMSERRRQAEIAKNREALKNLEDEEDWVFDCICGMYGHVDDGTHSVACEKCNIWQHSKCLGISEQDAERPDFHLVCSACRSRAEAGNERPKTTVRLKVNHSHDSEALSAPQDTENSHVRSKLVVELPSLSHSSPQKQQSSDSTSQPVYKNANGLGRFDSAASNESQSISKQADVKPDAAHIPYHPEVGTEPSLPMGVAATPSPTNQRKNTEPLATPLLQGIQVRQHVASSPGSLQTLSTPRVEKNGFPARAGISPTKHSPRPLTPVMSFTGSFPPVVPPTTTLSPTSRQIILTPPVKSSPPRAPIKSSPPRPSFRSSPPQSPIRSSPPRSPVKSSPPRPSMAAE
jgi:hypothetical protein